MIDSWSRLACSGGGHRRCRAHGVGNCEREDSMIDSWLAGFIIGSAIGLGMAFGVAWTVRRVK